MGRVGHPAAEIAQLLKKAECFHLEKCLSDQALLCAELQTLLSQVLYRRDEMQHVPFPLVGSTSVPVQNTGTGTSITPSSLGKGFISLGCRKALQLTPLGCSPLRHSCPAWRAALTPMLRDHISTCSNSRNVKLSALLS